MKGDLGLRVLVQESCCDSCLTRDKTRFNDHNSWIMTKAKLSLTERRKLILWLLRNFRKERTWINLKRNLPSWISNKRRKHSEARLVDYNWDCAKQIVYETLIIFIQIHFFFFTLAFFIWIYFFNTLRGKFHWFTLLFSLVHDEN